MILSVLPERDVYGRTDPDGADVLLRKGSGYLLAKLMSVDCHAYLFDLDFWHMVLQFFKCIHSVL